MGVGETRTWCLKQGTYTDLPFSLSLSPSPLGQFGLMHGFDNESLSLLYGHTETEKQLSAHPSIS